MKTRTIFLCTLIFSSLLFMSCKKYAEGPAISFRSRAERVANTWKMERVVKNGNDITSAYTTIDYTETYTKDGAYSYISAAGSGSGKWEFLDRDSKIKRSGVSGQPSLMLTILKLKEDSFWYRYTDGGDDYEFHLVPK